MKKVFLTIFVLFLICSSSICYSQGYTGCEVSQINEQVIVTSVEPKSPAMKSGIKTGDIIVSANGIPISSKPAFDLMVLNGEEGDTFDLIYSRKGKNKSAKIVLFRSSIPPDELVLLKLLLNGEPVELAVIVLQVSVIAPNQLSEEQNIRLENAYKTILTGYQENHLLNKFKFPTFSLIDRGNLDKVLKEIDFSSTGYISDKERMELGNLLKVTHLYCITAVKSTDPKGIATEVLTKKLIEVKSGKVLASPVVTTKIDSTGKIIEVCSAAGAIPSIPFASEPDNKPSTEDQRLNERKAASTGGHRRPH